MGERFQRLEHLVVCALGGGLVVGPAGTAAVNAGGAGKAGLVGGLSFMFHLGLGAIGIACATALMFATAIRTVAAALSAAGVSLPESDLPSLPRAVCGTSPWRPSLPAMTQARPMRSGRPFSSPSRTGSARHSGSAWRRPFSALSLP